MMKAKPDNVKQRVQTIIVSCSVLLMVGKFVAYLLTNSVGILTDALESIVNVTAGFISLYAIYKASRPKDEDHPFGHGKIELISASVEGIMIIIAGAIIVYEGVQRLFLPSQIEKLDIGIIVVAFAGLANYLLGWYSIQEGKKHDSIALVAGGKHLQSDTYSTIGLVAGLMILYFTKLSWIDSALAIVFGFIIAITGIGILRKTIKNLIDTADSETLEKISGMLIEKRKDDWIDVHNMRVVKYGSDYHIDCDLTLPWFYNIKEGHQACDALRLDMENLFPKGAFVSIHSDPCQDKYCVKCSLAKCAYRKSEFKERSSMSVENLIADDETRRLSDVR